MMKHLFLLTMVSVTAILAHAENSVYNQNISCDKWKVLEFRTHMGMPEETESHMTLFYTSGDTTINHVSYRKVLRTTTTINEPGEYIAAIREDGKQVYVYYIDQEYLLYDFGAQVGDERQIFSGINDTPRSYKNVIKDIHTLEDGRKVLDVEIIGVDEQDQEFDRRPTKWIEGIGSKSGLLYTGLDLPGGFIHHLLCAYKSGQCIYTTDDEFFRSYLEVDFSRVSYTIRHASSWMTEENETRSFQYSESQVVNGHTYWQVPNVAPELWIRQEDSRVYALCAADNTDLILYDYSLNAGDSLQGIIPISDYPAIYDYAKNHAAELPAGEDIRDYTIYIDSIGYTALQDGTQARTQFIRYNISLYASELGIIDGIGSLRGIESMIFYPISTDGARNTLLCYHVDNVLVYEAEPDACPHNGKDGLLSPQQSRMIQPTKQIINGQLIITVDGIRYDARGTMLK